MPKVYFRKNRKMHLHILNIYYLAGRPTQRFPRVKK